LKQIVKVMGSYALAAIDSAAEKKNAYSEINKTTFELILMNPRMHSKIAGYIIAMVGLGLLRHR
jgi:hypothetical protein